MTDRIRTLTVTLDRDTRTDDLDAMINLILAVKGVSHVERGEIADLSQHLASEDYKRQVGKMLQCIIYAASGYGGKEGQKLTEDCIASVRKNMPDSC